MKFKFISTFDPQYRDLKMLRWEYLEKPYGLPPEKQDGSEKKEDLRLAAFDKDHMVGCVLCTVLSEEEGEVFDFVLSDEGKGAGRKMMHTLEEFLRKKGLSHLFVIAAENAWDLYRHFGYVPEGEYFERFGIRYKKMGKKLSCIDLQNPYVI